MSNQKQTFFNRNQAVSETDSDVLPYPTANASVARTGDDRATMLCPNCGRELEGRKCKLFCLRAGCGYLVTCSEW